MNKTKIILAIETSCDETAAAIISSDQKNNEMSVLSNIVSSQIKLHQKYGGVYPELASREHNKNIIPVLSQALSEAKLDLANIDYFAITTGPGLIGSLLVGTQTVKTLAYILNKPVIPVHHVEGHIYANLLNNKDIKFPLVALVVSGGHTSLIYMPSHLKYEVIGQTIDDAAGEAYDKVSSMLKLQYPGGPLIDKLANNYLNKSAENKENLKKLFPRPLLKEKNYNFSFSGLKTAVLYYLKNQNINQKTQEEVSFAFQEAVTDTLVKKTLKACKDYNAKTLLISGGVAANQTLRDKFTKSTNDSTIKLFLPEKYLCTDNALMIAIAASQKLLENQVGKWYDINTNANQKL